MSTPVITERTKISLKVLRALGFTLVKSPTGSRYYSLNGKLIGVYNSHTRQNYLMILPCMLRSSPNRVAGILFAANTTLATQLPA